MVSLDVTADAHGPIFDGRAAKAAAALVDELQWSVGMASISEVQFLLDRSLRNPTPYYETQITIERQASDVVVHDRGIIYGPWLEGTGSRNRTTRFKGYHSFRRAAQAVDRRVPAIARRIVRRYLPRMG
jgi:hypothetical protein